MKTDINNNRKLECRASFVVAQTVTSEYEHWLLMTMIHFKDNDFASERNINVVSKSSLSRHNECCFSTFGIFEKYHVCLGMRWLSNPVVITAPDSSFVGTEMSPCKLWSVCGTGGHCFIYKNGRYDHSTRVALLQTNIYGTGTLHLLDCESYVKADSHIACRAHAVPLPCCAAKCLECVFPTWFTQCGRVWFTLALPRPCHALTMPFFSRPRHSARVERLPVGYLPAYGFFRLPRGVPRRFLSEAYQSSSQRSIPTTVKSGISTLRKRRCGKLLD